MKNTKTGLKIISLVLSVLMLVSISVFAADKPAASAAFEKEIWHSHGGGCEAELLKSVAFDGLIEVSRVESGGLTEVTLRAYNEEEQVGLLRTEKQSALFASASSACSLGSHISVTPIGGSTQVTMHSNPHPNYCVSKVTQSWKCNACYTTGSDTTTYVFWCTSPQNEIWSIPTNNIDN